jgi:hypothetical protein
MAERVVAKVAEEAVVDPLKVERGIVGDHDRLARGMLLQPRVESEEDLPGVQGRACRLGNRGIARSRARGHENAMKGLLLRVSDGAEFGQRAERRTAAVGFAIDEDEAHWRSSCYGSPCFAKLPVGDIEHLTKANAVASPEA